MKNTKLSPENFSGTLKSPIDIRDFRYKKQKPILQESFSLKTPVIKDQKHLKTCVANSLSYIIEEHNNLTEPISTGFIYGNRIHSNHKKAGLIIKDALKGIQKEGAILKKDSDNLDLLEVPQAINRFEQLYPSLVNESYKYSIKSYVKLNEKTLKNFLYSQKSYAIGCIKWYQQYRLEGKDCKLFFNKNLPYNFHAVTIIGWNKDGWIVANSWGKDWGNNGTFILPYTEKFVEIWGTIDDNNNNLLKLYQNKTLNKLYKTINRGINYFQGGK